MLKKSSQELYGLICYAELRKKVGGCKYRLNMFLLFMSEHKYHPVKEDSHLKGPCCKRLYVFSLVVMDDKNVTKLNELIQQG